MRGLCCRWPLVLLALCCMIAGCSVTIPVRVLAGEPCLARPWPQELSDLSPDPAARFGRLDNGLRYVILHNDEPRGRVALYLDMQAGSLNEREDQRGLAHYLEHMLFNGSTHFPPGSLIDYFQSIGMQHGADTNAHTSYDETVCNVFLPAASREHLEQGLLVLADYARGALLLPEEVERERGVILAEKRARDSVDYRVQEARIRFLLAGTLTAERAPIGTEEVLRGADQARLREFYDAWYRPDNMILVAVGAVDPVLLEELIRQRFSPLSPAAPPAPCPEPGRVHDTGLRTLTLHEPELGHTELVVETVWNEEPRPQTLARERRRLEELAAVTVLRHRLERLVQQEGGPLSEASASAAVHLHRFGHAAVSARPLPGRWEEGLRLLVSTLRQALEFGFSPEELARVREELHALLEAQVQTRKSRDSRRLAMEIIRVLNDDEVFMSPEQELAGYTPLIEGLTPSVAHQALRRLWGHEARRVQVVGDSVPAPGPEAARRLLAETYQRISAEPVAPPPLADRPVFPYLDAPDEPAAVIAREELGAIGAFRVRYANGLVLNLKRTDFRQNEVLATLHFGEGRLGEPKPGMALLGEAVLRESGLGRLDREELRQALAGRNVEIRLHAGAESFFLNGKALNGELELLLQLMAGQLRDPAFRPSAFRRVMARLREELTQANNTAEGRMLLAGERYLAGGNTRYGMPSREEISALGLEELRDWLTPVLSGAALELSLVGDFDPEQVIALVGRHLGTLTRDRPMQAHGASIAFPAGGRLDLRAETVLDRALVVLAFPTADFWDIGRTRRLLVLAALLDDLLRRDIRERLGATYSPTAASIPSRIDPGFGVLRAQMLVEPARAEELLGALRRVAARLAEQGVDEDSLRLVREPILTQLKDLKRNNRYWLDSVLALSSRHPVQLEWPSTIHSDFTAIDAGAITGYARRYLDPGKAAVVVVWPGRKE